MRNQQPMTQTPKTPDYGKPFAYHYPNADELEPFIGRNWGICRATPANRERYTTCLSPQKYQAAEEAAIAARGWARPAEKAILDLLGVIESLIAAQVGQDRSIGRINGRLILDHLTGDNAAAVRFAQSVLAKARVP